ncbi:MAG: Asp-tRNA(Asn)/Glu-tRNA(Gln) amidotransferase subunit GatA [Deltaproteobacteria bacterium]|nr:Asp-tRNA(Asn)/Glu-tRNA(Gln) amidotransferase subunit GatA [Deltaproteobacteria bacterium]
MDLCSLTAVELADLVRSGEASARAIAEAHLARAHAIDDRIGAFLRLTDQKALEMADAVDCKRARGEPPGALAGVPVGLKDLLSTKGLETTCGSRILEGYVPRYDATVIERLRAADAVFLGKTNMDEFAMGSSTENSAYQITRNPFDPTRIPGGSSGGSAAAVAARMVPIAIGTDTGGSIRQPASHCGVTGLKPTYGRVSRWGLVAFASSLDQIGPFSRTVRDAALVTSVIAGHDPRDSTSAPRGVPDLLAALGRDLGGLKIGVPREYFVEGMDPDVAHVVRAAIARLAELGAALCEVSLPHTEYALAVYYLVATAEASSNLSRYDGVRYGLRVPAASLDQMYARTRAAGFGPEVKRRIMLGTYALSAGYYDAYYGKAQKVRTLVCRDFDEVFGEVDAIVAPTSPTAAFRLGERVDDPLQMYLADVFTLPASLAGLPAISVPCGFVGAPALPIGLQIMGRQFDEPTVLRVADAFERAAPGARRSPEVLP